MKKINLVILFSGNGGNMENIILRLHQKQIQILKQNVEICVTAALSNKKTAYGLKRLEGLNAKYSEKITPLILEHQNFDTREEYDKELAMILQEYKPDIVVLAGFMRILSPFFVNQFQIINIHPSLLPKYKGAHAIKDSFESGDREVGVSVHWVDEGLDSGRIILQASRLRQENEEFEFFEDQLHRIEHELYPKAIIKAIEEKL